jgi:hypothetical protein
MDDLVRAALLKWPNVPDCFGWLGLDARGDWFMRDDRTQAAGPFPGSKGSRIEHDKLRAFIERNYLADAGGRWYFQNGPQRVYVELEVAPWVWRLHSPPLGGGHPALCSHTGRPAAFQAAWQDEAGRLLLSTDLGLGLVHSQDMHLAADAVIAGAWQPESVDFATLPESFGYCLSPASG